MRELEKTFTWIVKLRSSRETESRQAKTGRRTQAKKEKAWEKPASARSQPRPESEAAQDSCSSTPGRSQDRWPPRACSKLFKGCGLYPGGHKKPLQGFKKETDMTRVTAQKDHSGCSVKKARVKDKTESRETREDSSGKQVSEGKD